MRRLAEMEALVREQQYARRLAVAAASLRLKTCSAATRAGEAGHWARKHERQANLQMWSSVASAALPGFW